MSTTYNKSDHEGNAKIAKFMEYELKDRGFQPGVPDHKYWSNEDRVPKILCEEGFTRYHLSWDWLIPVVEKCFNTNKTGMLYLLLQASLLSWNFDRVHAAVLEIIKYDKENNYK